MIDAPSEIPNDCELDVEQLASGWLGQVKNLLVFVGGRCVSIKRSALSMAVIPSARYHDLVLPPGERYYFENQMTSFITSSHIPDCLMESKIMSVNFLNKQA